MTDNGVEVSLSLPAGLPRWLQSRPFLLAGALSWRNTQRRYPALVPLIAGVSLVFGGVLTSPVIGGELEVAAQYPVVPFALLAVTCAIAAARRKDRVYRSLVDSWLATLAAPRSIIPRLVGAPLLQLALLLVAITIPFLAGSLSQAGAVTLWLVAAAACVAGSLVGTLARSNAAAAVPDFHYVTVRAPRMNWALAPKLEPLSYWAMGQARVATKPKVTATVMMFVLLSIPMGTGGEKAVAIAAGVWVLVYLIALCGAAVRVAFRAARWLAPTTIRYGRFTAVLGYRVLLAQLWTCAWVVFLSTASSLQGALRLGLWLSALCLVSSGVIVACGAWLAAKSIGMGAVTRSRRW